MAEIVVNLLNLLADQQLLNLQQVRGKPLKSNFELIPSYITPPHQYIYTYMVNATLHIKVVEVSDLQICILDQKALTFSLKKK